MSASQILPSGIPPNAMYTWCNTDIKETKIYFLWNIKNFSCLQEGNGASVKSSVFFASEDYENLWRLELYPRGMKGDDQYVSLFLGYFPKDKSKEITAGFEFSIIKNDKEQTCNRKSTEAQEFNFENFSFGVVDFVARDALPNLLQNDELKIFCDVTVRKLVTVNGRSNGTDVDLHSNGSKIRKLTDDLGQLVLQKNNLHDILLVAQDKETVQAHKVVLAARSTVFADMFERGPGPQPGSNLIYTFDEEEKIGKVEIAFLDPKTLQQLARFMYIREFPDSLDDKQAMDLLVAAERLKLKDLKELCENTLAMNLTDDNVVDLMPFATLHNCKYLKVQLAKFLKS